MSTDLWGYGWRLAADKNLIQYDFSPYPGESEPLHHWSIGDAAHLYVDPATGKIGNIWVRQEDRGNGLARALYEHAARHMDVYHDLDHHCTPEGLAFKQAVGGPTIPKHLGFSSYCSYCVHCADTDDEHHTAARLARIPQYLYHSTHPYNRDSILRDGLLPEHDQTAEEGHGGAYLTDTVRPGSGDWWRVDTARLPAPPEADWGTIPPEGENWYWVPGGVPPHALSLHHTAARLAMPHTQQRQGSCFTAADENNQVSDREKYVIGEYVGGQCAAWAVAHQREYPGLRFGIDWERITPDHPDWDYQVSELGLDDEPDEVWQPQHIFTHDDTHAYDVLGSRPLNQIKQWDKVTLNHSLNDVRSTGMHELGWEPEPEFVRRVPPHTAARLAAHAEHPDGPGGLWMHPDDLFDYASEHNPYYGGNLPALKDDIARHGIRSPIVIHTNGEHAVIADGHHRLQAAQELGHDQVPVRIVHNPYGEYDDTDPVADSFIRDHLDQHHPRWRNARLAMPQPRPPDLAFKLHRTQDSLDRAMRRSQFFADVPAVTAHLGDDPDPVGHLEWHGIDSGYPVGQVEFIHVKPEYRRHNIATAMFDWARQNAEPRLHHSDERTELGRQWVEHEQSRTAARLAMPWYHNTDAELNPGDELLPAAERGHDSKWKHVTDYDPNSVYFTWEDDDDWAETERGLHRYEVEPIGDVQQDPEHLRHVRDFEEEHGHPWDPVEDDEEDLMQNSYKAPRARVVRKLPVAPWQYDHPDHPEYESRREKLEKQRKELADIPPDHPINQRIPIPFTRKREP